MKKIFLVLVACSVVGIYFFKSDQFLEQVNDNVDANQSKIKKNEEPRVDMHHEKPIIKKVNKQKNTKQDAYELLNFSTVDYNINEVAIRLEKFLANTTLTREEKSKAIWNLAKTDINSELFYASLDILAELKPIEFSKQFISTYNDLSNENNKIKMLNFFERITSFNDEYLKVNHINSELFFRNSVVILEFIEKLTHKIEDKSSNEYKTATKIYLQHIDNEEAGSYFNDLFNENSNMSEKEKTKLLMVYNFNADKLSDELLSITKHKLEVDNSQDKMLEISKMISVNLLQNNENGYEININDNRLKNILLNYELNVKNNLHKSLINESPNIKKYARIVENISFLKYSDLTPKNAVIKYIENDATLIDISILHMYSRFIDDTTLKSLNKIDMIRDKIKKYLQNATTENNEYNYINQLDKALQ